MILIRTLAGKSTLYKLLCLRYIKFTNLQQQQKKINSLIFFYTDSQTESLGEKMFQITDEIRCHFQDLHTTALHLRKVSAFERACLLKT